jgi:hypothetical protein
MALEWIVPMALFGAFVSSSGTSWMRRQRRLESGRARGVTRGWVVPVRVRSSFPMDIRGEAIVDSPLDLQRATSVLAARAVELGYERTTGSGVALAFRRGSEWRALSSFDLCDVPSEIAVFNDPAAPAGVVRLRLVMTYRTAAHYVDDGDAEQATDEFTRLIEVLEPLRTLPVGP